MPVMEEMIRIWQILGPSMGDSFTTEEKKVLVPLT